MLWILRCAAVVGLLFYLSPLRAPLRDGEASGAAAGPGLVQEADALWRAQAGAAGRLAAEALARDAAGQALDGILGPQAPKAAQRTADAKAAASTAPATPAAERRPEGRAAPR